MDIDKLDEEQDKNRKLDKYEINDLDDIDDFLCKEYQNFEYNFEYENNIIILYAALSRQKVKNIS